MFSTLAAHALYRMDLWTTQRFDPQDDWSRWCQAWLESPYRRRSRVGTVGGSRHYTSGGLGPEGAWACPSCGAENLGPIAQGCNLCGAGRPGRRAPEPATPPPPPPAPTPTPAASGVIEAPDIFPVWHNRYPDATLEQAFTAGYVEGIRAARRAQLQESPPMPETFPPAGKSYRTMVAALVLFRDQILVAAPDEIQSGEWCSVDEVNQLITQLSETVHAG